MYPPSLEGKPTHLQGGLQGGLAPSWEGLFPCIHGAKYQVRELYVATQAIQQHLRTWIPLTGLNFGQHFWWHTGNHVDVCCNVGLVGLVGLQ